MVDAFAGWNLSSFKDTVYLSGKVSGEVHLEAWRAESSATVTSLPNGSTLIMTDGRSVTGVLVEKNERTATLRLPDDNLFTAVYEQLISRPYPQHHISTDGKEAMVRLSFPKGLDYHVVTTASSSDGKSLAVTQKTIVTNKLPYSLPSLNSVGLSFSSAIKPPSPDDIKLADDMVLASLVSPVPPLPRLTSVVLATTDVKLNILKNWFSYKVGDRIVRSKMLLSPNNLLLPGNISILDSRGLPKANFYAPLTNAGGNFIADLGSVNNVSVTTGDRHEAAISNFLPNDIAVVYHHLGLPDRTVTVPSGRTVNICGDK